MEQSALITRQTGLCSPAAQFKGNFASRAFNLLLGGKCYYARRSLNLGLIILHTFKIPTQLSKQAVLQFLHGVRKYKLPTLQNTLTPIGQRRNQHL